MLQMIYESFCIITAVLSLLSVVIVSGMGIGRLIFGTNDPTGWLIGSIISILMIGVIIGMINFCREVCQYESENDPKMDNDQNLNDEDSGLDSGDDSSLDSDDDPFGNPDA